MKISEGYQSVIFSGNVRGCFVGGSLELAVVGVWELLPVVSLQDKELFPYEINKKL